MSDTLIWYLLLPLILGGVVWWVAGHTMDALKAVGIYAATAMAVAAVGFAASYGGAVVDKEVWNGQVVAKHVATDDYKKPYDCNCRSVESCSGSGSDRRCSSSRVCDTCYEDRYTKKWWCDTTVGSFTILSLDESSKSVWNTPDPQRWTIIKPGDPAAKTSMYTNYVQAVPGSLFRPSSESLKQRFANLIPSYPDQIYDFYRINRFLTPGYNVAEAPQWNEAISQILKIRGPQKQVNAIVVIAKTDDQNYVHALRDAWEGANKNDVVLVIGSAQWPKIDFVDVISWTKSEMFKIQLRDEVYALGTVSQQPVINALANNIDRTYVRRQMAEFEYLQGEIDPPAWLLIMMAIMNFAFAGMLIAHYRGVNLIFWKRKSRW